MSNPSPLPASRSPARPHQPSTPRKPWLHAPSGFWCAQIDDQWHYLDRDPVIAERKLKKLLQDRKRGDAHHGAWLDGPFSALADEFLDDVKARRKPDTYRGYREMLELAIVHLGTHLRVADIRKLLEQVFATGAKHHQEALSISG